MSKDIFTNIVALERRADELVARAKAEAEALHEGVERRLKALTQELAADYEKVRQSLGEEMNRRRDQALRDVEESYRAEEARLETVRIRKVAAVVQMVVGAFLAETGRETADVH